VNIITLKIKLKELFSQVSVEYKGLKLSINEESDNKFGNIQKLIPKTDKRR
jgi:hypothetical protein